MEKESKYDIIKASIDHLIAISFPKTTSNIYPLAVNIAHGAAFYNEIFLGKNKKLVHLVAFDRTREDAGRACALIRYVSGWKGTQCFSGGKLIYNFWSITQVLECFLEASACNDWTAHCYLVIDDPYIKKPEYHGIGITLDLSDKPYIPKEAIKIDRYIFPCKLVYGHFKFQLDHPAKLKDQIQSKAVIENCNWCPFFNSSNYKKIGTKIIYRDVFT